MDNKTQGNLAEIASMFYYRSLGFSISKPLFEDSHVDLHIQKDGIVFRIQVKSSGLKKPSGSYEVSLRTSGGNQSWNGIYKYISKDFVDLVFIYCLDSSIYEYDSKTLDGRTTVAVNNNLREYKGKLGLH